ncbi:MAG: alanine--glyoxylate aminotransferase [Candidatus Lambdaproteobacteria bacterium RIFOXYD1_FULL_56_27]|uniref:Alanine--glyoxylate aminotransferase n=1 Tax=Candidatus Lambdaproteobacteria bacterium RIFOXYD2_FULL_56_26 TaxID=1817773 RepID=A0A1F6H446_9PROT|nr:MAG: alanine--glyoxylate aminotransferase [Candidatus Lambdaproteobacteria bacterium RIFOXYC1_FULL_56_13]OGH05116.1 MAG: alanine--glyoxylate aminotransferase [Candidatus Lambdaproteobacteria bacterium RIFOXYD2_FULL_56_26]OGH09580.1 MAG: alanine--glyoxylate aminotransferase [Candidatus Lambdaproteobacteria bacterium RIFOXYD1_FULL_56_27]
MNQPFPSPVTIPLNQILPQEPLLLMGAGPVPIPAAVAQANGVVINHLGDTMNQVIAGLKQMARYAFQTGNEVVMGVAGPASAAMEMGVTNLLWPGRKALVLENGTFSARMGSMAEAVGAEVDRLKFPEPSMIDIEQVKAALAKKQYDVVTLVQGETSCGIHNANLPEIVALCKAHGALVVVDAVVTLTTMPLWMDQWKIDVCISGGQKGISSIPGVSLIAFSKEAWEVIEGRSGSMPHWCLDARKAYRFWGFQQYHYTAPVPGILALYEALRLICEETLQKRFERHKKSSEALQAGIEAMGLELFVPKEYRLNSVVAISIPKGVDGYQIRKLMATKFNVEIAGAFGLDILRIGQMGEQCRSHNVFKTLYAMGMSFKQAGFAVNLAAGMAALEEGLGADIYNYVP